MRVSASPCQLQDGRGFAVIGRVRVIRGKARLPLIRLAGETAGSPPAQQAMPHLEQFILYGLVARGGERPPLTGLRPRPSLRQQSRQASSRRLAGETARLSPAQQAWHCMNTSSDSDFRLCALRLRVEERHRSFNPFSNVQTLQNAQNRPVFATFSRSNWARVITGKMRIKMLKSCCFLVVLHCKISCAKSRRIFVLGLR